MSLFLVKQCVSLIAGCSGEKESIERFDGCMCPSSSCPSIEAYALNEKIIHIDVMLGIFLIQDETIFC